MTRRLAAATLSLLSLLTFTACTGGDAQQQPAGAADSSPRIVVASGQDVTGKNGIRQQLIDAWNAKEGEHGYRARLVELPGSADQQRSQLLGALQSGSAEYDVVNLDVTWIPEFAEADLIRPLSDSAVEDPEDLIESVDSTSYWDGTRYAVPFNSDAGLLYYRKDHLVKASASRTDLGDDVTWGELRQLLGALDRADIEDHEAIWTTQLAAYEGRTVNAIEAFASAVPGFRLTDDDGDYVGTEEQLTRGVTELRERTQSPYLLEGSDESREAESLSAFAEGRTTFLRHWPYVYPTLHETFGKNLGVARLPGKAVLGGQSLAVTSSTSEQRAAKAAELIAFLTDPDSERCLLRAGFAATRSSAYEEAGTAPDCRHARAYAEGPTASPTPGESTGRTPPDRMADGTSYFRAILRPALRAAVERPRTPLYGAVTHTLTTELDALYGPPRGPGGSRPGDAEVAKSLDEALRKILPG
ncbi:extracellular solute-binding protein [Streptomyces swartbergensis]|uniref:ABC transporter substrate-binding protein n=1 Tax=Streptomyces swartbergensis TaxID=487165 RepID=A0A243RQ36_9ACTN|nr:extracellular solute-binding protein [Streptomyces swartbergensis]OUC97034.1 ABC transporter substrate-binding protein [Streptomyces swartbergensis]